MDADDKKQMLKAWKASQKAEAREGFPAPVDVLEELFDCIDEALEERGCDHTYRFTRKWIESTGLQEKTIVPWLQSNGGYCDCEVIANVEPYVDENR